VLAAIARFAADFLPTRTSPRRSAHRNGQLTTRRNGVAVRDPTETGPFALRPLGFQEFLGLEIPPREMLLSPILPERRPLLRTRAAISSVLGRFGRWVVVLLHRGGFPALTLCGPARLKDGLQSA